MQASKEKKSERNKQRMLELLCCMSLGRKESRGSGKDSACVKISFGLKGRQEMREGMHDKVNHVLLFLAFPIFVSFPFRSLSLFLCVYVCASV